MSLAGWIVATGLGDGVVAGMSTRQGGVSAAPFDSLNLRPPALPGGPSDDPAAVAENHRRLALQVGGAPVWLEQVHGVDCVRLSGDAPARFRPGAPMPRADASITTVPGVVCSVLVADCLPVLFSAGAGRPLAVGVAHAGWRGLSAGVLERTVEALCEAAACTPHDVRAWMGACIGPTAFEVGAEVLQAFGIEPAVLAPGRAPAARTRAEVGPAPPFNGFREAARPDGSRRWRADLGHLARSRLLALGLDTSRVTGPVACTVSDASRFFSYRRDRLTGRMAACIRLEGSGARA